MKSIGPAVLVAAAMGIATPAFASIQTPESPSSETVPTRGSVDPAPEPAHPNPKIDVSQPGSPTVTAPGLAVERVEPPSDVHEPRSGAGGGSANRGGGGQVRHGRDDSGGRGGWRPVHTGRGSARSPGRWGSSPVYLARPYYYDPFWASGAFGWSPMFYAPWSLIWATGGYGPFPGFRTTTFDTGSVRLKIRPRDAQVFVDGFFAGVVDEFDGVFQSLRLAPGGHKLEVRMPGFESLTLDLHVQPDRRLTVSEAMKPSSP